MSAPQYILCIETGTDTCSVALARDGRLVALRESHGERDHAARVAVYTEEVLAEAGLKAGGNEHGNEHGGSGYAKLSAVAVSKGPGSYTGLRIGVSFAKGLCYGLGIPLIGVGSLESLCAVALSDMERGQQKSPFSSEAGSCKACDGGETAVYSGVNEDFATERNAADIGLSRKIFVPMIDARRMEVFAQVFDSAGNALTSPEALIVDGRNVSSTEPRMSTKSQFGIGEGDNADGELRGCSNFATEGISGSCRGIFSHGERGVGVPTASEQGEKSAASETKRPRAVNSKQPLSGYRYLSEGQGDILIFGSGAAKCREALPWARYIEVEPSARGMIPLATAALEAGSFENTAYFEPFYLKDFVVTTSKKKLF